MAPSSNNPTAKLPPNTLTPPPSPPSPAKLHHGTYFSAARDSPSPSSSAMTSRSASAKSTSTAGATAGSTGSSLPSIRSLKSKFQNLAAGGWHHSSPPVGPKVITVLTDTARGGTLAMQQASPGATPMARAKSVGALPRPKFESMSGPRPSSADGKSKLPKFTRSSNSSPQASPRISSPLGSRQISGVSPSLSRRIEAMTPESMFDAHQFAQSGPGSPPPSRASAATKAESRISSDFMRPQNEPPLSQLRANRTSLLVKRPSSVTSSNCTAPPGSASTPAEELDAPLVLSSEPHTRSPSLRIPAPTVSLPRPIVLRSRIPSPATSSRKQFPSITIDPQTSQTEPFDAVGLADQRPFSPSPVPQPFAISAVQRPPPQQPSRRDDMAYRRLSLSPGPSLSGQSPRLGSSREGSPNLVNSHSFPAVPITLSTNEDSGLGLDEDSRGRAFGLFNDSNASLTSFTQRPQSSTSAEQTLRQPDNRRSSTGSTTMSHKASAMSLWQPSPTLSAIESFSAIPQPVSGPPILAPPQTPPRNPKHSALNKDGTRPSPQTPATQSDYDLASPDGRHSLDGVSITSRARQTSNESGRTAATSVAADRTSGNTFGEPEPVGVFRKEKLPEGRLGASMLPRNGGGPLDPIRTGLSSSLMRRVESGSPVLVQGGDEHVASLARSQSARQPTAPSKTNGSGGDEEASGMTILERRRLSRSRKAKSESYEAAADEERSSPLDELIAGLGGRRQSAGSEASGPKRTSLVASRSRPSSMPPAFLDEEIIQDFTPPSVPPLTISPKPSKTSLRPISISNALSEEEATAERMEREIQRMETELLLSGSPRRPRMNGGSLFDSGTSLASSSYLERPLSSASTLPDNASIRTARSWNITEVDRAYERMKQMLGSTRSQADSVTVAGSDMGDEDVERLFETALDTRRAAEATLGSSTRSAKMDSLKRSNSGRSLLLSDRPSAPEPLPAPASANLPVSSRDTLSDLPPPVLFESPHTPKANGVSLSSSTESFPRPVSLQASGSSSILSQSEARLSRRHTLNAPVEVSRVNGFDGDEERRGSASTADSTFSSQPPSAALTISTTASPRATRRRSYGVTPRSSDAAGHSLVRSRTAESLRSNLTTASTADGAASESDGWMTPLTSPAAGPGSRRARSRLSGQLKLRSGAGKEWAEEAARPWSRGEEPAVRETHDGEPISHGRNGSRDSAAAMTGSSSTSTPTQRMSVNRSPPRSNGASNGGDTWFAATPDRATMRVPQQGSGMYGLRAARDADSGSEASTIATIKGMDKLEVFFKYTAIKADLDRAELERDALLDALQESRAALADVRMQRDGLEDELQKERQSTKHLKKFLSSDAETQIETLDSAVRARQKWERRARDALEDLDRVKAERDELHKMSERGRANNESSWF